MAKECNLIVGERLCVIWGINRLLSIVQEVEEESIFDKIETMVAAFE